MPFDRPDLRTLLSQTVTDLNSRFTGSYNVLRRRATTVIARVLAGMAHGLYGYIDWVSRQILPDTQDEAHLLRYGAIMGVTRILEGYASGALIATGTDGALIDAGTIWQRSDGAEFVTTENAEIVGGTATVLVQAVLPGTAANTDAGEMLDLVSPIAGVMPEAQVDAGLTGGQNIESIDAYRQRVLVRTGTYYTGANAAIYHKWATEFAGVTRAWVYENTPANGSVTVLFVCDDEDPIIPDGAKIAALADYMEEHTDPTTGQIVGRAVNAILVVDAPTPAPIDFTITPTPNTAAVRAAIEAELADMLSRDAEPGGTIYLTRIHEAISIAAGEETHTLTVPAADVVCDPGEIAIMGTITWP